MTNARSPGLPSLERSDIGPRKHVDSGSPPRRGVTSCGLPDLPSPGLLYPCPGSGCGSFSSGVARIPQASWDPGPEWPAGHGPSIWDVRFGGPNMRSVRRRIVTSLESRGASRASGPRASRGREMRAAPPSASGPRGSSSRIRNSSRTAPSNSWFAATRPTPIAPGSILFGSRGDPGGNPLRPYRRQVDATVIARHGACVVRTTGAGSGDPLAYFTPNRGRLSSGDGGLGWQQAHYGDRGLFDECAPPGAA